MSRHTQTVVTYTADTLRAPETQTKLSDKQRDTDKQTQKYIQKLRQTHTHTHIFIYEGLPPISQSSLYTISLRNTTIRNIGVWHISAKTIKHLGLSKAILANVSCTVVILRCQQTA